MMRGFGHIDTWVFDLDNTLYPASCRLFDQIDVKIGAFVSQLLKVDKTEAQLVQKSMFYKYGTTLRGLMIEHDVKPEDFLDFVHDIDHAPVACDPGLDEALHALPGRKLIFTNGTVAHAEKVLRAARRHPSFRRHLRHRAFGLCAEAGDRALSKIRGADFDPA